MAGEGEATKQVMIDSLKSSWIIILVVAAMFILVLVVIYIVSMVKKNKLQNVSLQQAMIDMNNRSVVPYTVSSSQMSLVTNGQEFSYCFWIILSSNYDSTSEHKLVWQRGNTTTTGNKFSPNSNPIVFMDKTVNKMYICVSTTQANKAMSPSEILETNSAGKFTSGYLISTIDYIPLQRWVFVGIVVKDTTLYVFLDGDLYSATTVYDVSAASQTPMRPIIKGTNGDLLIGEKVNTIQGFVSNSKFFNYGLTQPEMQSNYNQGPSKTSLLSMIGLNNYGVRSPIYEING
jgi:hypothetical protein